MNESNAGKKVNKSLKDQLDKGIKKLQVTEKQLALNGFNVVIYANHMLRASYPAMAKVAGEILRNGRSKESDKKLMSINEILNLIPGTK